MAFSASVFLPLKPEVARSWTGQGLGSVLCSSVLTLKAIFQRIEWDRIGSLPTPQTA